MANRKDKNRTTLRKQAEKALRGVHQDLDKLDPGEMKDLLHELQVYQVELEMQNDELRRAQQELELTRDKYTELYDFAPVGYLSTDENGMILRANLTFTAMLGMDRKDLVKQPLSHFIAKEDVDQFYLKFTQFRKTKLFPGAELRFERADGTRFTAKLEALVVENAGDENSFVRMGVVDISDRKQMEVALRESEAKFRSLYDTMNEGVCLHEIIYDRKGHAVNYRILDVNPAYESIVGIKPEKAVGCLATKLYGTGKPPYLDIYAKVVATGVPDTFETYFAPMAKHFSISVFSPAQDMFATIFADITERKKAEAALKLEHEQLLIMFDGMDEVIYVIDSKSHEVLYMNGAAKKQWGEAIGCKCYSAINGMDEPCSFCTNAQIFGENLGKTYTWEHHNKLNERWYRCIDRAIRWPDGRMVRLELAIDITDRKEAEQALAESEAEMRSLLENSPDYIISVDRDGKILFVNRTIPRHKVEEAIGRSIYDFIMPKYHDIHREKIAQVFEDGKAVVLPPIEAGLPGRISWYETRIGPVMHDGQVVSVMLIARDIAERKKAEQALADESNTNRFMAGLSATILKGTSIQEISELILDAAKQFTGSKYGFVSFIDQDTGHMVSPTMTEDIWEQCQIENRVNIFHEFKGLWGWVLEHGKPLMTNRPGEDARSTGTPEGHVGIERFLSVPAVVGNELVGQIALANADRDYTEKDRFITGRLATLYAIALQRWRWEKALQQAKDDLEKRVEERTAELKLAHDQLLHAEKLSAIGKLSASIAHEFNNPLFGIRNVLAGIKRRAALETEDKELVKMALQECDRIKFLIQDLQDFNRPTSGVMAPMDVNKAADSILLLLKKEYKNRKIKIIKRFAEDMPKIRAVADQIKQVLLNLLNNAADAIGEGGGTVTISTQVLPNQTIAVHIQDTGPGIKPGDMKYIFDPFFTTKPEVKGTGLGLSVSYGIVKRHGGRIDVLSELGKGATFTIILPVAGPS